MTSISPSIGPLHCLRFLQGCKAFVLRMVTFSLSAIYIIICPSAIYHIICPGHQLISAGSVGVRVGCFGMMSCPCHHIE